VPPGLSLVCGSEEDAPDKPSGVTLTDLAEFASAGRHRNLPCNYAGSVYDQNLVWGGAMRFSFWRDESQDSNAEPTRAEFPELSGADIAGVVHGKRVGGDFYQSVRATPARVLFGLLDVAGAHTENRGIVAAANQTFREKGPECLASEKLNEADAMMEFCHELNVSIVRAANGVRSCAAFVGCYNEYLGTVCYVNAGHTPGLLRYNSDVSELAATGMPLGLFVGSTYEAPTAAVPRGGALLLVSRGVVEATRKKEEFGLDRLKQSSPQSSQNYVIR
jgi:serine phosphatase RsbU (regulator of sigma subunit)